MEGTMIRKNYSGVSMLVVVLVMVMSVGLMTKTCVADFNVAEFVNGCVATDCVANNLFLASVDKCTTCVGDCRKRFQPTGPLADCGLQCATDFCHKVVTPNPTNLLQTDVVAIAKDFLPQCITKCAS
ncbi:hypothetical protein Sjap_019415 [Stephania japonica]|uniref:Uncharacterized protein n=1 Tax=Stephania japonica TaxID=461633 RepID=A0AAP0F015_9MAGN